jgi:hypothetical protein
MPSIIHFFDVQIEFPAILCVSFELRARAKITSHFCISASAHLWPMPHSQYPQNSSLFLWFCSFGSAKPEPNLSAISAKLFFHEPLEPLSVNHFSTDPSVSSLNKIYLFIKAVKADHRQTDNNSPTSYT